MAEQQGHWIEQVFIDNELIGGMWQEELPQIQEAWRKIALEEMSHANIRHVEYCSIKYDEQDLVQYAHFYIKPMNQREYDAYLQQQSTRMDDKKMYVGLVHGEQALDA